MKVVIVGGVAAGAAAAARLRRNDEKATILILEKDEYISYSACGLPYFIGDVITDGSRLLLQTPQGFKKRYNIDVRVSSEVTGVDTVRKLVEVKDLKTGKTSTESYDELILTPGAAPVVPPIEGIGLPHVFTLRSMADGLKIKEYIFSAHVKTAVVIGAGHIGLEITENLKHIGVAVTLIDAADHVIPSIDTDMAYEVHNHLRSKGVNLLLNTTVKTITPSSVVLAEGESVPADIVFVCIGSVPNTGFLRGNGSPNENGVKLGLKGGIIVDDYLRTTAPHVYAAGDAIVVTNRISGKPSFVPFAGPAARQARIVADAICGKGEKYTGSLGTELLRVFDITVGVSGLTESLLRDAGKPFYKVITTANSRAGYFPGTSTITVKLIFGPKGELYGTQAMGSEGIDKTIDVLAVLLKLGCTVHDLPELEHGYAPPYSIVKDAVNVSGVVAEQLLEDPEGFYYIEDVAALVASKELILDIRNAEEYRWGHIEGAVNMPLDTLRENLDKLDKNRILYAYCQSGARCNIAVQLLRQYGFKVKNLGGGYRFYSAMDTDLKARNVSG
ncbi:MAG: FAD-dependent oxidoreductase [Spirochaetaceae bacterium]|jgi:NADPH-dependent 2,4-dienoyl-CoA reductase/sulfur reductase-like enzyme/rhodanese-related sulfurtransferase|nr:FAD-dependent oxidoreductase [Spirochaetaceae bacterium]